jgi:D,D-heptose 1,7-bisphosphate phosphatase
MENVKQAAILIGGKGTRLGNEVQSTPKPLLEVCGRPFVEHVMLNLRRFGFDSFILLAGYQSDAVQERYSTSSAFAKELQGDIKVIVEPSPMGTGGALKYAKEHLQAEFLLLNGDSIFDFNYLDLCNCVLNQEPDSWLGRIALLPVENASRYGFVELHESKIAAFREKPQKPESGLINSGVYWLKSEVLDFIGDTPCSLEQDVFPRLVEKGRLVGRTYHGFFIDIGIPEDLQRARDQLLDCLKKPAAFLDRDGTLNHDDGYTYKIEEFQWLDGAKEAIKKLNDSGYLVFIVTNQAGIARGYYDAEAVDKLHNWMQLELSGLGAHFDDIRYCPHHPDGSVPELSLVCDCRKPNTGMLKGLIEQWNPIISRSFMLGDSDKDAEAGKAVGLLSKKIPPTSILNEVEIILQSDNGIAAI